MKSSHIFVIITCTAILSALGVFYVLNTYVLNTKDKETNEEIKETIDDINSTIDETTSAEFDDSLTDNDIEYGSDREDNNSEEESIDKAVTEIEDIIKDINEEDDFDNLDNITY